MNFYQYQFPFWIFTARKRSLGQGNVFTRVCHSVYRGEGVCVRGGLHPEGSWVDPLRILRDMHPSGMYSCSFFNS